MLKDRDQVTNCVCCGQPFRSRFTGSKLCSDCRNDPQLVAKLATRPVECVFCNKQLWREPVGMPRRFFSPTCEECLQLERLKRITPIELQEAIRCGYSFAFRFLTGLNEAPDRLEYLEVFQRGGMAGTSQFRAENPESFARLLPLITQFVHGCGRVGPLTAQPERGGREPAWE